MELADALALEWRAACRKGLSTPATAKEFARLLEVAGARASAAQALYTMGEKARAVRRQAHSAFLKEHAGISARQSQGIPVAGPDLITDRSLYCLDDKLRRKRPPQICRSLDRYLRSVDRRLDAQRR
ncbi:MAG: hypothetical protein QOE79_2010 [Sphingomonadales bacterium]|nr:hypothetical protein [Sphingomonadales bacterium]